MQVSVRPGLLLHPPALPRNFKRPYKLYNGNSGDLSSAVTFTRSSAGFAWVNGVLTSFATNIPRIGNYENNTSYPGLILEPSGVNNIANSSMTGAVVGTPGTIPTGWRFFNGDAGVALNVVGVGTSNGLPYIDVRAVGTTTGSSALFLQFTAANEIAATSAQVWTASTYMALIAGTETNFSEVRHVIEEQTAIGVGVASTIVNEKGNLTSSLQRRIITRTLNNVATFSISSHFALVWTSGGLAIDATYRIALPVLEQAAFEQTAVPTSTVAVSRGTDNAIITSLSTKPWFNPVECTIFVDFQKSPRNTSAGVAIALDDTGDDYQNYLQIVAEATQGSVTSALTTAGVQQFSLANTTTGSNDRFKAALAFRANDVALAVNGVVVGTDTSVTLPTFNRIFIGRRFDGLGLGGTMADSAIYPSRLSNARLVAMTGA